jgi:hypothetical protein
MEDTRPSLFFGPDFFFQSKRLGARDGRVSACGRKYVGGRKPIPSAKERESESPSREDDTMAKSIILYNLKEGVSDEEYRAWCEEYKGPFFLSLGTCKSFTLVSLLGGVKGDGSKGLPPQPAPPPYKYLGIVDVNSLEEWQKETESSAFTREFFPQWFSKWVGEFYVLVGSEVYQGNK